MMVEKMKMKEIVEYDVRSQFVAQCFAAEFGEEFYDRPHIMSWEHLVALVWEASMAYYTAVKQTVSDGVIVDSWKAVLEDAASEAAACITARIPTGDELFVMFSDIIYSHVSMDQKDYPSLKLSINEVEDLIAVTQDSCTPNIIHCHSVLRKYGAAVGQYSRQVRVSNG